MFSQNDIIFVDEFHKNDIIIENEILISNDFVQFKNTEIDITISNNNELLELQFHPLGIKWSGSFSAFQNEYNNFISLSSDKKYHSNKKAIRQRDSLLQINDAILIKDTIVSFSNKYSNFELSKIGMGANILAFPTIKYKNSDSTIVNSEIWFGYKLNNTEINSLVILNTVIQKITSALDKTYSSNLNYLRKNYIPYFPLKVTEHNVTSNTVNKEEIVAFQQKQIDKNKYHSDDNYQSISLFDFLLGAKTEISK